MAFINHLDLDKIQDALMSRDQLQCMVALGIITAAKDARADSGLRAQAADLYASDEIEIDDIAGTSPAEAFAALMARVAKLEARLAEPEIETCSEPAAESGLSHKNMREIMRPARLRLVRRYLAMRAERDRLREGCEAFRIMERANHEGMIAAEAALQEQAECSAETIAQLEAARTLLDNRATKAEARAEAAEFELSDLRGKLAAVEKRATDAEATWQPLVDKKQARIVELEDRLLQIQSGGRINGAITFKPIGAGFHLGTLN